MHRILTTPFLENGDRLNRWEFEKRYQAMGKIQKAELIEGVVYMPAALRFRSHVKLARSLGEETSPGSLVNPMPIS